MPKRVQRRGQGNDATSAEVGLAREVTVNTDQWRTHVHDGETPGGHPSAKIADLPWVNPKMFGAVMDGASDDSAALAAAAAQGNVFVQPGTLAVGSTFVVPSNRIIMGAGPQLSIVKRLASFTANPRVLFAIDGTENATIQNLGFELNNAPQFFRAIGFRGASAKNIKILDSEFHDANPDNSGGDRWAINLATENAFDGVWIERCRCFDDMQLTAGGGVGGKNIWIADNYCYQPKAAGIALTLIGDGGFDNVHITGNTILRANGNAIYLGTDQGDATDFLRQVEISRNIIDTTRTTGGSSGIYIRCTADSRDISITDNIITMRESTAARGIKMENNLADAGSRWFRQVKIVGNVIRLCEVGIDLSAVDGLSADGNLISEVTRGFQCLDIIGATYRGNDVGPAFGRGFLLRGHKGTLVQSNRVRNLSAATNWGFETSPRSTDYITVAEITYRDNIVLDDQSSPTTREGFLQNGSGTYVTRYVFNRCLNLVSSDFSFPFGTYTEMIHRGSSAMEFDCSLAMTRAGAGLRIKGGTNATSGNATLDDGEVVVSNTSVTANSKIFVSARSNGQLSGYPRVLKNPGVGFTIRTTPGNGDDAVIDWMIIEVN